MLSMNVSVKCVSLSSGSTLIILTLPSLTFFQLKNLWYPKTFSFSTTSSSVFLPPSWSWAKPEPNLSIKRVPVLCRTRWLNGRWPLIYSEEYNILCSVRTPYPLLQKRTEQNMFFLCHAHTLTVPLCLHTLLCRIYGHTILYISLLVHI